MLVSFFNEHTEIHPLGAISHSVCGSDQYLSIKFDEDFISASEVKQAVNKQYMKRCSGPGQYFCDGCTFMEHPYLSEIIAIIHHRYDV